MGFEKFDFTTGLYTLMFEDGEEEIVFTGEDKDELYRQKHEYMLKHNKQYRERSEKIEAKGLTIEIFPETRYSVGSISLVGIGDRDYPLSHGNYWSIVLKNHPTCTYLGKPVVNMWYENFAEAVKRFNIGFLDCVVVNGLVFIANKEIPLSWLMDKPFLEYNLHRGISHTEDSMINKWYSEEFLSSDYRDFIKKKEMVLE